MGGGWALEPLSLCGPGPPSPAPSHHLKPQSRAEFGASDSPNSFRDSQIVSLSPSIYGWALALTHTGRMKGEALRATGMGGVGGGAGQL